MIYLFAGSANQASDWIREHAVDPHQVRYIGKADQLRGIPRGPIFARIGTWYERPDCNEIEHILEAREAAELSITRPPVNA